jgi:hypothetical protein
VISDELDKLSEEEQVRAVFRLTGAILFEVGLTVGLTAATGGLALAAVAARAGKLTKLLDDFGFLSKQAVQRIEGIIERFLKKADDANCKKSSVRPTRLPTATRH